MTAQGPGFDAVQAGLRCPSCGGQRAFDPQSQGLKCDDCGALSEVVIDTARDGQREMAYDPGAPEDEPPEIDHAHRCDACGGEVVFVGRAVSENCPYCDGPVVLFGGHAHYAPSGLIPFGLPRAAAEAKIAPWLRGLWAAPGDLAQVVAEGHMAAIYAPFWTFDASKAVDYRAQKRVGSGKRARWRNVSGRVSMVFDDAVVGASDHVTPAIRDGIIHGFNRAWLKPYQPEYLAGFAADLHGMRVSDGLRKMMRDVEIQVEQRIRADARGRLRNIDWSAEVSGVRFRRVLLPLWILHYRYADRPYRIVVSGIDGRCFGERPFATSRLMGLAAMVGGLLLCLGMALGAGLAPT